MFFYILIWHLFSLNLSVLTSCCPCFSSLTSRLYWKWMTKRTIGSGHSSTWMLLTCASPPLLPLPLRARLKMTAWMSMSGDQVGDWTFTLSLIELCANECGQNRWTWTKFFILEDLSLLRTIHIQRVYKKKYNVIVSYVSIALIVWENMHEIILEDILT